MEEITNDVLLGKVEVSLKSPLVKKLEYYKPGRKMLTETVSDV